MERENEVTRHLWGQGPGQEKRQSTQIDLSNIRHRKSQRYFSGAPCSLTPDWKGGAQ
ncbi:hypothetical protein CLV76_12166 [Marivita geojedonensis]|nr:hypothetical protein CLV76_12166 [Marivita geojedonensis]